MGYGINLPFECITSFIADLLSVTFPLPSARQHPSYGACLEVKREYYQNSSVLDCVTQCSQAAAHLCEQFLLLQCFDTVGLVIWPVKIVPEMTYYVGG